MEEKAVLPTSSSGGEWMLPFTTWARVHTWPTMAAAFEASLTIWT